MNRSLETSQLQETFRLETPRLRLRPFRPDDLDAIAPLFADPEVMRFSAYGPLNRDRTRELFLDRCLASYRDNGFGWYAIAEKATQGDRPLLGFCGLSVQSIDDREEIEIGYRLARAVWGCGFATEAARAVRDDAIARLGCSRLI